MVKALKFLLILLMLPLSACENDLKEHYGRPGMFTMRPMGLSNLPSDDSSYSQGLRDGCNSALGSNAVGPMSSSYADIYMDVNRNINDIEYYKGRTTGFNYCTYYTDPDPL